MLGPDSITWHYAGDWRFVPFLARAFLLQVAHPTIAAGVGEHSVFEQDPWGRLMGSYGLVLRTVYGPDGERTGSRVRAAHGSIRGLTADGRPYSAYEPEAYFWVVATGAETVVEFAKRIGRPLGAAERDRAYGETREIGRRFGLRDGDMPPDRPAFEAWYGQMLTRRLEPGDTLGRVLKVLSRPGPPRGLPAGLWPGRVPAPLASARPPAVLWSPFALASGHLASLIAIGTLPEQARERLGLSFSATKRLQLDLLCASLRLANDTPGWLRYVPLAREAHARGVAEHGRARSGAP
jgi:uncharacterized protein (DUF2236 family)